MKSLRFSLIKDIVRDRRGVSAVEFAFIAPILILFYFASVELSMMLTVDRKVTTIASSLGDLVAQDDLVDAAEVADIFLAAQAIMDPYDSTGVQMRVSSVIMDASGDIEVSWSQAQGMGARACGSVVAVPDGVLAPGQSVILAEVDLTYNSPIAEFLTTSYVLSDTFYLRPRRSIEVAFNPPPC